MACQNHSNCCQCSDLWGDPANLTCDLVQIEQDGGKKTLEQVLPFLKTQGYSGVECSVKMASVLNQDGIFTQLMKAGTLPPFDVFSLRTPSAHLRL